MYIYLTGKTFKWFESSKLYQRIHVSILKQYKTDEIMYEFIKKHTKALAGNLISENDLITLAPDAFFMPCLDTNDKIIMDAFGKSLISFLEMVDNRYQGDIIIVIPDDIKDHVSLQSKVLISMDLAFYHRRVMVRTIENIENDFSKIM